MLSFECIKNEKSVYFLLTSADQPTSPAPHRKRAHTGSFSQIVSILGEVKLVNIYIRYSWHLGSH